MSSTDDALDYLESLVILDHICPFALDRLPEMSRRVFDVGLDMSRMRHGLRSHRERKRSKSSRLPATQDDSSKRLLNGSTDREQLTVVSRQRRSSSPTPASQDFREDHPEQKRDHNDHMSYTLHTPNGASSKGPTQHHEAEKSPGIDNDGHDEQEKLHRRDSDGSHNYDLKPPPPRPKAKNVDTLAARLLSSDHLEVILRDPTYFLRFTAFLNRYRPQLSLVLVRYLEFQKAYRAVEYANALAETALKTLPTSNERSKPTDRAASVDPAFEEEEKQHFETLVTEALPAYVTNCLSRVVTEYMVKEITGSSIPIARELVGGLAEVFCLADPNQDDCPLIYASEEFFRTSRYSSDDALGRNCRYLQGRGSDQHTIDRIKSAVKAGEESCETILNYRRDGTPFMNLLLIAPLYDNRGSVKYFIGAQIDVTGLVEDGRGLDSFERLLSNPKQKRTSRAGEQYTQKHLRALSELGQLLSGDESSVFSSAHSRDNSNGSFSFSPSNWSSPQSKRRDYDSPRRPRVILGAEKDEGSRPPSSHGEPNGAWSLSASLPSGRLPGVYQNYFLVRPHPNLRIVFVSPSLRIPGLLQSPFLAHINGPPHVRSGIADAFEQGAAVTAKVEWCSSTEGERREVKTRFISCTPLLGTDEEVGVWVVVMVENESVTGSLVRRDRFAFSASAPSNVEEGKGDGDEYSEYMRNSAGYFQGRDGTKEGAQVDGESRPGTEPSRDGVNGERKIEEVFTPSDEVPNNSKRGQILGLDDKPKPQRMQSTAKRFEMPERDEKRI